MQDGVRSILHMASALRQAMRAQAVVALPAGCNSNQRPVSSASQWELQRSCINSRRLECCEMAARQAERLRLSAPAPLTATYSLAAACVCQLRQERLAGCVHKVTSLASAAAQQVVVTSLFRYMSFEA